MTAALLSLLLLQSPGGGALEKLADDVATQARTLGAVSPLAVTVSAPGHPALQDAFMTLLFARLSDVGLPPLPARRGNSGSLEYPPDTRSLLRLRLTLDAEMVVAAGDLSSTWVNFFAGAQPRPGKPAAILHAEVDADAAVRGLAGRADAPTLTLVPEALARWPVRTAALAAGDLHGDGKSVDLAILTEDAVEVRALDGRLLGRRTLDSLPLSDSPPREAFGTLCICDGILYAYDARRAHGETLVLFGNTLLPRAVLARPVVGCGFPRLEASFVPGTARLLPWGPGWPAIPPGPAAWGLFSKPNGALTAFLFLLEDGTALATVGSGPLRTLPAVGAGAALVGSGLTVAASTALPAPAEDRVRLLGTDDGKETASVTVPGRVLQVAPIRLEAEGTVGMALVLGVWRPDGGAELRLVRGAP